MGSLRCGGSESKGSQVSNVYLILNETTFKGTEQITTEVTEVYDNLQGAMDYIADLAEDNDVVIEEDADSVYLPPSGHIESDEYYIVEMELRSNG